LKRLLILWVVILGSPPLWAACPLPGARIALHEFPPFYYPGPEGAPQGTLVALFDRLMRRFDCQWSMEFQPVPRMLANIAEGRSDLAMLIHHPQLETHAQYGRVPVGRLILKLFRQPDQAPITALSALPRGARVIVRRGYGYSGYINQLLPPESGIQLVLADSHQQAVELLRDRKGDYLLSYQGPTDAALDSNGLYHITGEQIASWPIYLLISKRISNAEAILARLDAALDQLQEPPLNE